MLVLCGGGWRPTSDEFLIIIILLRCRANSVRGRGDCVIACFVSLFYFVAKSNMHESNMQL